MMAGKVMLLSVLPILWMNVNSRARMPGCSYAVIRLSECIPVLDLVMTTARLLAGFGELSAFSRFHQFFFRR
jgi:hypothetical protein